MFSIFSLPKPFLDEKIRLIQTNAINSWLGLSTEIEVILLGSDQGVAEFCLEKNIKHIPLVKQSEAGTPLLDDAFRLVRQAAKFDTLVFVNCDIILSPDFLKIFNLLPAKNYLVAGQRVDLEIEEYLDFSQPDFWRNFNNLISEKSVLHQPTGSDYFIFKKNNFFELPPFAVGRTGWDNWMFKQALRKKFFLIDASPLVKVIHQNHDYKHKQGLGRMEDTQNLSLSGGQHLLLTLRNAPFVLTASGYTRRPLLDWQPLRVWVSFVWERLFKNR
jgi:hypothetical protein